jgi:hypothetical protein
MTLEVESIDRMYLNVYVPRLPSERGVVGFFRYHRGHPFASSALMEPISKAFVSAIEAFAARESVPLLTFAPGQLRGVDLHGRAIAAVGETDHGHHARARVPQGPRPLCQYE